MQSTIKTTYETLSIFESFLARNLRDAFVKSLDDEQSGDSDISQTIVILEKELWEVNLELLKLNASYAKMYPGKTLFILQ